MFSIFITLCPKTATFSEKKCLKNYFKRNKKLLCATALKRNNSLTFGHFYVDALKTLKTLRTIALAQFGFEKQKVMF